MTFIKKNMKKNVSTLTKNKSIKQSRKEGYYKPLQKNRHVLTNRQTTKKIKIMDNNQALNFLTYLLEEITFDNIYGIDAYLDAIHTQFDGYIVDGYFDTINLNSGGNNPTVVRGIKEKLNIMYQQIYDIKNDIGATCDKIQNLKMNHQRILDTYEVVED